MTSRLAADPAAPTRTADGSVRRLAAGALLAGRYRILELIGVGGMGMVYKALDERLELEVAVKVLRPELATDTRRLERFKHELVLARQVSHPNVIRNHDFGSDGEVVFLTMDFFAGRSLAELLEERRRLELGEVVEIAAQIASALAAAHDAGVVHRDLKPGNVLIDASGRAVISDFGVARSLATGGGTVPGAVVGTLDYLSPEQARGDEVDGRADLYALGILIYEMLTGELPFAGGSEAEVLAQRLFGSTRDLSQAAVKVPHRLAGLARRLLARDPADRPQRAREVLSELENLGARSRRRWWGAALAAVGVLGLSALVWVWSQQAGRPPRSTAAALPARHAVALLPLADETGRPELAWLAAGLPEMLAASLAEGPGLRVLDSARVFRTLESLKVPPRPLTASEARRLAELLDADRLVSGRVRAAGGEVRVDLSLVSTELVGESGQAISAAVAPDNAFRLVEELGASLRSRLDVPPVVRQPALSRSPEALAAYSLGAASLRRGEALAALEHLERAVAADGAFSAAWVRLALARDQLGRREPAREAARRAVTSASPGDNRGALEAQAVEAQLDGKQDRAQEILSQLVERFPEDAEARVALGEAYGQQGNLEAALAALGEAVRLAPHHPRAWFLLAKFSILGGDASRAIDDYLVHALVIQNQLDSDEGRAEVSNALGVAYKSIGEVERARESYQQAATLRRRLGDQRGYATTLRNLANLALVQGEQELAESQLREAQTILEGLGDTAGLADLYNDFGLLAEERGDSEAALAHYQRALRARRDLGNDLALAQSFSNVGYACYQLGRYDDALVYWGQGLDLAQQSGDLGGVIIATQNLGLLQLARGEWDKATKGFLSALATGRELGLKEAIASCLGHLGRLAQLQGRPAAALASFAEAIGVLRELDDRRGLTEFTLAQAEVELELGREKEAGAQLAAAAALLTQEESREQHAELERLRGEWHLLRGEREAARQAFARALTDARDSHSVVALLDSRLSAAAADLVGGRSEAARAALEGLHEEANELGHARLRLRAAAALAAARLAAGAPALALAAAQDGLALSASCGGSFAAHRLHRLAAAALARLGRTAEAAAERSRAAEEIARVGRDLEPQARQSFEQRTQGEDRAEP